MLKSGLRYPRIPLRYTIPDNNDSEAQYYADGEGYDDVDGGVGFHGEGGLSDSLMVEKSESVSLQSKVRIALTR